MVTAMATDVKKFINVLCLDGGGVRGLSSLIILRKLLCLVNVELKDGDETYMDKPVLPSHVFDLVVGTSTGGLIALMIVKMGMDVDQCIDAYKALAQEIFKKWHLRGLLTCGFGRIKKFSGRKLEKVIIDRVIKPRLKGSHMPENYCMEETTTHEGFDCTVVCREIDPRTQKRRPDPVYLCTERCRKRRNPAGTSYQKVKVRDAACATTAAPTFFKPVRAAGKLLVDGGYGETNNPSFAAWQHFFIKPKQKYSRIHFINIGTGTHQGMGEVQDTFLQNQPIHTIRNFWNTIVGLKEIATNSEYPATVMTAMAAHEQNLTFERFSANKGGIRSIELFDHMALPKIEELTNSYLEDQSVLNRLKQEARKLAITYRQRRYYSKTEADAVLRNVSMPNSPADNRGVQDGITPAIHVIGSQSP